MQFIKPLAATLLGLFLATPAFAFDQPPVSICQYKGPDDPGCGGRPAVPCCDERIHQPVVPPCRAQYGD